MDLGLKGRTALVTGGSSGIGFAIAEELVKEGAGVVVMSRDFDHIKLAEKHLKRLNPSVRIEGKQADLTDEAKLKKAVKEILAKGHIDILVNNVGGPASGHTMDIKLEDWDKGYTALVRSVLILTQALVPGMRKKKWGRVLTVTSTSAREIIPKLPVSGLFRAGLTSYAKSLAKDVGREGVLINNLLPGPINTGCLEELKKKAPAFFNTIASETALGRVAEPEEIARIAVFLCSGANSYLTGCDVLADGGYTRCL